MLTFVPVYKATARRHSGAAAMTNLMYEPACCPRQLQAGMCYAERTCREEDENKGERKMNAGKECV